MVKRVALVGASSTGKTTVFDTLKVLLSNQEYTFKSEIARTALKYGFPINENGTDSTQLAVSNLHLEALLTPGNLMLDRCYLDLVVYTGLMEGVSSNVSDFILDTWDRVIEQYTHFVYFPIEFDLVKDGVRSEDGDWRVIVNAKFKEMLESLDTPYLTVTGDPSERATQILKYIE